MAGEFENKKASNGVHYSRIIASWHKEASKYGMRRFIYEDEFRKWLSTLNLTEEEQQDIYHLATNGKMELEDDACRFLKENCTDQKKLVDQFLGKS